MKNTDSDLIKKSVPISELKFDPIKDDDKALVRTVRKNHITSNIGYLVILFIMFALCGWFLIRSIIYPASTLIIHIGSLLGLFIGTAIPGYFIYGILRGYRGIRKGIILSTSRLQEEKDNRNKTYQYVADIYMEDIDRSLISYPITQDVYQEINPGDGVVLLKAQKSVVILPDPQRVGAVDVKDVKSSVSSNVSYRDKI